MKIRELKEIIKNIDDEEEILVTMTGLKYLHHVNEIRIDPLDIDGDIVKGVVIIGCKYY